MKKIFLVLAIVFLAITVRGQSIVVDTFQGNPYELSFAYDVGNFAQSAEIAAPFIAQVSGKLATIDLGLTFYDYPYIGAASAYLYGDANGSPDNANQTFLGSVTPNVQWQTTTTAIVSISVAGTVPVTAGTTYWLVLKAGAPPHHDRCDNTFTCVHDMWNVAIPHVTNPGPGYFSFDDVNWTNNQSPLPAFRITANTCTPDTWTSKAPMPQPVSEACSAVFRGQLYIFDGSGSGTIQPTQVYDPAADSWTSKLADPAFRAAAAAGLINDKIYVAEGWVNADSNAATQALEIYDPMTDSWTAGASSQVARGNVASAVIGGRLYITGGRASCCGNEFGTLEIYDPARDRWSSGTPIPIPVEGAAGVAINCKFYVIGGFDGSSLTGAVQIYDPATDTWTSGSSMPTARGGTAAAVIDGKIYVAGGDNGGAISTLEVYNPTTNTWTTGTSEPTAGSYVGGVIDSKFYAVSASGTLEVYTAVCPGCISPPSGAVGWWPGDGNANDIIGGNNGTLQGGTTFASGEVGQAFSFDGNNQYVLVGDPVPSSLQIQK